MQAKLITRTHIDDISSFFGVPIKKNAKMFAIIMKKYAMMCQMIIALFITTSLDRKTAFSLLKPNTRMTQDITRDKLSKIPKITKSL